MPTFNTDLAEHVLAVIKDQPETWNQGSWIIPLEASCGTAYCFAGHALAALGYKPILSRSDEHWMYRYSSMVSPSGELVNVEDHATGQLGLTSSRAYELFKGSNSLEDLELIVKDYANEPVVADEDDI